MPTSTWLALITPLVPLLVGALVSRGVSASAALARQLTLGSALAALATSIATTIELALSGPGEASFVSIDPAGYGATLSVHVDALTVVMMLMISIVGSAVSLYAIRYLDGDPQQARFSQWLAFTLGAVLLLVVSGNLVMLWLAWVMTSLGLHRLLLFYPERPAAQRAAKKKFIVSRVGDAFLLFAFLLIYLLLDTVEYTPMVEQADQLKDAQPWTTLAGLFLVLGAMTKSAQLPLHTWLPDTMETPTPVSAFMHAGIINAGGFLLVRLSPILTPAPLAMEVLALVGGLTAVFASVVMLTQTDIKRKLAYSTVGQMGFMMLQIGLGAFSVAVLHIVGHSFYKAHAFLSAASTVRTTLDQPKPPGFKRKLDLAGFGLALVGGVALVFLLALVLGANPEEKPGLFVLGAVLAMAVAQMVLTARAVSKNPSRAAVRAFRNGALVAVSYFLLAFAFEALLTGSIPSAAPQGSSFDILLTAVITALFFGALLLQVLIPRLGATPIGRRLYVHVYNGFYLGTLLDRFVERMWPTRAAR